MAVELIEDRAGASARPWHLSHHVQFADRRSKWALVGSGRRDGARNIPHVADNHLPSEPLSEAEWLSVGSLSRLLHIGSARIAHLGMEFRADEARLVERAIARAAEIGVLRARAASLGRRRDNFDQDIPAPEAPKQRGRTDVVGEGERRDTSGGYDASRAVNARNLRAHEQVVLARDEQRRRLVGELDEGAETQARLQAEITAVREELVDLHDMAVRDADRHRSFAAELMSMYWTANQRARRSWWRRLWCRLRHRPLPPIPLFSPPLIARQSWESTDPCLGLEAVRGVLVDDIATAIGVGTAMAASPHEARKANAR